MAIFKLLNNFYIKICCVMVLVFTILFVGSTNSHLDGVDSNDINIENDIYKIDDHIFEIGRIEEDALDIYELPERTRFAARDVADDNRRRTRILN
jgi:hypothetical protein